MMNCAWLRSGVVFSTLLSLGGCAVFSGDGGAADAAKLDRLYVSAEQAYAARNFRLAEESLVQALEIDPNDSRSLYRLATIQFRNGEIELAAVNFGKVIAKDPRHSRAHYNLATIRLIQAEQHFKYYTATTDPKTDVSQLGKLLASIEEFAEASKNRKEEGAKVEVKDVHEKPEAFGAE